MAEGIESCDKHPIFSKDPEQWTQYLNKEVLVVSEDGTEWTGWVYTIDPVSETIVLLTFQDDRLQMSMVMGHSVRSITVTNEDTKTHEKDIESLFRPKEVQNLSDDELEARKNKLKSWLLKNRLPVSVTGNNGDVLSVSDALFIEPPYGSDHCRSTNEIILGRIQGLIKNMPADHEDW